MAYSVFEWACVTPGCPGKGLGCWGRKKGPKAGQWVYKAYVCRGCQRPMKATGKVEKKYSLAELL